MIVSVFFLYISFSLSFFFLSRSFVLFELTKGGGTQKDEFFLLCDPHHTGHKILPQPAGLASSDVEAARRHFKIPDDVLPLSSSAVPVSVYEVVDHVPNPVWSSEVVSVEEVVDHAEGLWVRIRSPLSVVMETNWIVREQKKSAGGRLELVEDVTISCSRLLLGIVKGQVEGNWKGIHDKIIGRLVADAAAGAVAQ